MAAATITTGVIDSPPIPGEESVVLTVSDGETYTAKTLSSVTLCHCTWAEDDASTNAPTYSVSGRVVTIHAASVTDKLMALTMKGKS